MRRRALCPVAAAMAFALLTGGRTAADGVTALSGAPGRESLAYTVEWRLIHAGNARLDWAPSGADGAAGWQANLQVESVGLVSRLYKVNTEYSAVLRKNLCAESSLLKTREGSRRRDIRVTYDSARKKASLLQKDLVKGVEISNEIDILPCEYDVIGALYQLRTMAIEPGRSAQLPVSDGRKHVMARVEAQERETIKTGAGVYKTIRYEAFLFNDVLYRRRGRLFVWLTDDGRKLPVQVRVRLPFYVGTITLQLQKDGKS
jgi:hypothetical protein